MHSMGQGGPTCSRGAGPELAQMQAQQACMDCVLPWLGFGGAKTEQDPKGVWGGGIQSESTARAGAKQQLTGKAAQEEAHILHLPTILSHIWF